MIYVIKFLAEKYPNCQPQCETVVERKSLTIPLSKLTLFSAFLVSELGAKFADTIGAIVLKFPLFCKNKEETVGLVGD